MKFNFSSSLAVAIALLAGSLNAVSAQAEKSATYRFGVWKLHQRYDTFTGRSQCTLRTDYVDFDGQVLSFHLNGNPPTVDADFRINAGPVLHASDYQQDVESKLIFYRPGPLSSRDDGVLRLPAALFTQAAFADVKATPKAHSKHFNFDGFPAALAYMKAHGCEIDETRN